MYGRRIYRLPALPFAWRIVLEAMRRVILVTIVAGACARPVLYYPTPESAGIKPSPASAPASASASAPTAAPVTTAGATPGGVPVPADPAASSAMTDAEYLLLRHILVPVAGADMSRVEDTFNDARDGDRVHHAIDILAPRGTPILAADDGRILRMSTNTLGGISMYTVDPNTRLVYYYAHMDHYNDAMSPGRTIVKGDTLGFVGTTGNAPKDTPHLHFQVMRWPSDGKYWNGEPIDPFEALGGLSRAERAKRAAGQPPKT
jgi:murein DD-endopeptidase MepM/ murein hydrolase activator NlpD